MQGYGFLERNAPDVDLIEFRQPAVVATRRVEHRLLDFRLVVEDRLDRQLEDAADAEGEGEARVVAAVFDRVHGLARDFEAIGQVLLRPFALGAQDAEAILHIEQGKLNLT